MPKVNHLHPIITENRGDYRPCDAPLIAKQIGKTILDKHFRGTWSRIVEVDDEGNYTDVGINLMMSRIDGVRVLYNWFDYYDVQRVVLTDTDYTVLDDFQNVDAMQLPDIVESLASY